MWTKIVRQYYAMLDQAKMKMSQLKSETQQTGTSQSKLASFFGAFKGKLEQVKGSVGNLKDIFKQMPKLAQNITNNIKNMGKGLKQGLGHVLKYAGALFSLRSIYSVLSNLAQSWLSSQNAGTKQLSANIEHMKYAMGSVFAPVIQWVINLVYQLMKAFQSVVYALFKVNIFANASAKSYSSMASSANKAKKETQQLAGIHDELNNISNNNAENGNSGSGSASPSFDLSEMDNQMSLLAQKLYDFFKPLKESWDNYGSGLIEQVKITAGQVGGLISSVWGSFENIITNGTVYTSLQLILTIIGNIAEAFTNAWNYNNNGDVIVQNLANAFNNLLGAINNVVQSEGFQLWLNWCSEKFREISEKIASIDWQPLIEALMEIGETVGSIALEVLSALVDIFKWLTEHPDVAKILLAITIAIGVVSAAISIASAIMAIWNVVSMPITITIMLIVAAIMVLIAIIVLVVENWEWLCEMANQLFTALGEFFSNLWQGICDTVTNIWNGICDFISGIWNGIKDTAVSIFNGIKNAISTALNGIQQVWSTIWNAVSNVVKNVWNGIWNCIKGVINTILGGIEGFVNGVIRGINFLLSGISSIANAVGSLIGLSPINLKINTISLPRLAKGGVLTEATAVIAGEYSGASTNPEIVTPQNIMRETMEEVFSKYQGNSNDSPIHLTVNVNNKKLGQIVLEDLREMKRQTGNGLEALVGG